MPLNVLPLRIREPGEALEDPLATLRRDADAAVGHVEHGRSPSIAARSAICPPVSVALIAFSIRASSAQSILARSTRTSRLIAASTVQARSATTVQRSAACDDQVAELDTVEHEEARTIGERQDQQAVGDLAQPLELPDHDVGVLHGERAWLGLRADQFRVPARDRDRGPQPCEASMTKSRSRFSRAARPPARAFMAPAGVPAP